MNKSIPKINTRDSLNLQSFNQELIEGGRVLSEERLERAGGSRGVLKSPGSQSSYKRSVSFNEQDEVIFFDKLK